MSSHPITCRILFLLLPVGGSIFECASMVILLVASLAVSRWTNCCLHCSCIAVGGVLDEAPAIQLNSDPVAHCCVLCGAMICWCGKDEEDDNEKMWDVLRNLQVASSQNGISNSQLAHSTQDESRFV